MVACTAAHCAMPDPGRVGLQSGHGFDYNRFLDVTNSVPADHPLLFYHHRTACMAVSRAIVLPGMLVVIKSGCVNAGRVGRVIAVDDHNVIVLLDDAVECEISDIELYHAPCERNIWTSFYSTEVAKAVFHACTKPSLSSKPLYSFVKVGSSFEIICKINPTFIHSAVVEENRHGLLKVKYSDDTTEYIHMCSHRCKPLGWNEKHSMDFCKSPLYVLDENVAAVPSFCFDVHIYTPQYVGNAPVGRLISEQLLLAPHRFEVGGLMVIIDPVTRFKLLPAFVSQVVNNYFFIVTIMSDLTKPKEEWPKVVCHSASDQIAPFNYCNRDRCSTWIPAANPPIESYSKLTVDELSARVDEDLNQIQVSRFPLPTIDSEIRSHPLFDMDEEIFDVKAVRRVLPRQLVEVFLFGDYSAVHIGRVLRVVKHFVVVSIETYRGFRPPILFPLTDINLFPLGFASECGIAVHPPAYLTLPCVSLPDLSLFSALECTPEDKTYVPGRWLKESLWCPTIYVNSKCFCGPFIPPQRRWRLKDKYGPGPLPYVLNDLISDLSTCGESKRLLYMLESADIDNVFTLQTKFYYHSNNDLQKSGNRTFFRYTACKTVYELPIWLNILNRMLDACPIYISLLDVGEECPLRCDLVPEKFPYMLADKHINTAYTLHNMQLRLRVKRKPRVEETPGLPSKRYRIATAQPDSDVEDDFELDEDEEEEEEDSDSMPPVLDQHRLKPSITRACAQPIRPRSALENHNDTRKEGSKTSSDYDSDDVLTLSSDSDVEEIPFLQPEVARLAQNNARQNVGGGPYFVPQNVPPTAAPPQHAVFMQQNARARPMLPQTVAQVPKLSMPPARHGGARIRYPGQRPNGANAFSTNQMLLRPSLQQRPLAHATAVPKPMSISTAPLSKSIKFDTATGKYRTSFSFGNGNAVRNGNNAAPVRSAVVANNPSIAKALNTMPPPPSPLPPVTFTQPSVTGVPPVRSIDGQTIMSSITSDPRCWRAAQVAAWIEKMRHYQKFAAQLFESRIDGATFMKMRADGFVNLGLKLGPAMSLQKLSEQLRDYTVKQYGALVER